MPLGAFGFFRCPVLRGIGVGTTVLVWIDAAIFAARFQGFDGDNIALFVVDGVLLRVPCFQIRAVFT
ncbi:MAG: hypothetical protein K6T81_09675 [Alicyclobacillus macrosporangiidus]|uniref:hypothetical protein n=1 Tax=Alicyclobacillus macrosporangiidus TaxID=392015 RepID=UPI0026F33B41|nr:hypothetical protein [Alicyclobacillus macrosporangiidus]MCL6599000.1 hypothetical protein [Alicyclobacillus macrosporangiidus]